MQSPALALSHPKPPVLSAPRTRRLSPNNFLLPFFPLVRMCLVEKELLLLLLRHGNTVICHCQTFRVTASFYHLPLDPCSNLGLYSQHEHDFANRERLRRPSTAEF